MIVSEERKNAGEEEVHFDFVEFRRTLGVLMKRSRATLAYFLFVY